MDAYGLLPSDNFLITTGRTADQAALPQAMRYFRDETIALPKPGLPLAGFAGDLTMAQDLAAWAKTNQPGGTPTYPPLVWVASPLVERDVMLDPGGTKVNTAHGELALQLVAKLPLNGSWFDASSTTFCCGRP